MVPERTRMSRPSWVWVWAIPLRPAGNFTRATYKPGLAGSPYRTAVCGKPASGALNANGSFGSLTTRPLFSAPAGADNPIVHAVSSKYAVRRNIIPLYRCYTPVTAHVLARGPLAEILGGTAIGWVAGLIRKCLFRVPPFGTSVRVKSRPSSAPSPFRSALGLGRVKTHFGRVVRTSSRQRAGFFFCVCLGVPCDH